jgi:L-ascorbate metabolism protein UlaG (beta-lactamase superfamily)
MISLLVSGVGGSLAKGGIYNMRIQWFGQSCFMIISDSGVTIITDPFGKPLPYRLPDKQPDIVTVSHDHPDHNNTKVLKGNFELVKKPVETEIKGVKIKGIVTYHDNSGGKKRGQNIVFKLTVDEITICHLGDLGHVLNEDQVQAIGDVDILLLPVGGRVTIDAAAAAAVKAQLHPTITIPMHFRTKAMGLFGMMLNNVSNFLDLTADQKIELSELAVTKEELEEKSGVITLSYQQI